MSARVWIAWACLLAVTAWANLAIAGGQRVGQGDELLVVIPEGDELKEVRAVVDGDGVIALGIYGRVQLDGLDEDEARAAVEAALSEYLSSTAGVTVRLERRARRVLVTGHVKKPGAVRLVAGETMWEAVMRAGGPASGAALERVILHGEQAVTVDLGAHLRGGGGALPEVKAGDTIFVPAGAGVTSQVGAAGALLADEELRGKIFVLGAVRVPGLYERGEGGTTSGALAAAGGPTASAALGHARLLTREGAVHVDLLAVMMGEVAAGKLPQTEGGLILYVPSVVKQGEEHALSRTSIMGNVARPGEYPLRKEQGLVETLARAGGPTDKADASRVTVVRREGGMTVASTYDVERYLRDGGPVALATVRPGDVVHVPGRDQDALRTVARFVSDVAIVAATFTLLLAL